VLAEQEMAVQEERERLVREGKEGEEPRPRVWKRPVHKKGRNRGPVKGEEAQEKEKQPKQVKIRRVPSTRQAGSDGAGEEAQEQQPKEVKIRRVPGNAEMGSVTPEETQPAGQ
jgi:hypothetical protein